MTILRLGTRRSRLATSQSQWVADLLRDAGHSVELVPLATLGDLDTERPLRDFGGSGAFASTLRRALRDGVVDLAVHSLKDVPTAPEEGLVIAAIPRREDPRDALITRDGVTLGELPSGARVGTGSLRRRSQLLALGYGLEVHDLRGNVETRLAAVTSGALDGVVLALAGLRRLGLTEAVSETLDPLVMLPAPGQGALAVETRDDDPAVIAAVSTLEDPDARACVEAERSLLATLEAGCSAPVGALAEVVEGMDGLELSLRAFVGAADGSHELRRSLVGEVHDAAALGARLAGILLEHGAADRVGASGR